MNVLSVECSAGRKLSWCKCNYGSLNRHLSRNFAFQLIFDNESLVFKFKIELNDKFDTNNKHMILCEKNQMNCEVFLPKNTWSLKCVIPLQHPGKSPDLDSFSDFLEN